MLYYFRHALAVYMESVLSHRRLSFLVCLNFLWPCSLIETSDRLKWDSPITKWSFIFSLGVRKWSGEKLLEPTRSETRYARRAPRSARNDIRSSIWSLGVRSRCRSRKWRLTWPCCRRKKRSANWLCCRWRKRPAISISANESLIGCVPPIRLADWLCQETDIRDRQFEMDCANVLTNLRELDTCQDYKLICPKCRRVNVRTACPC